MLSATLHRGDQQRLRVATDGAGEQLRELVVTVGDAALLLGERMDLRAERGERAVDGDGLLRRVCTEKRLDAGQVHKLQPAIHDPPVVRVGREHLDADQLVRTGRAIVASGAGDAARGLRTSK